MGALFTDRNWWKVSPIVLRENSDRTRCNSDRIKSGAGRFGCNPGRIKIFTAQSECNFYRKEILTAQSECNFERTRHGMAGLPRVDSHNGRTAPVWANDSTLKQGMRVRGFMWRKRDGDCLLVIACLLCGTRFYLDGPHQITASNGKSCGHIERCWLVTSTGKKMWFRTSKN